MAADASPSTLVRAGGKGAHLRVVYLATAVSALGGMLFGYDIGVISGDRLGPDTM